MHELVLENGLVFANEQLVGAHIGIDDGRVSAISKLSLPASSRIDCHGKIILPGFIDLHAHMREPGYTYKEDFESGSRAAAAGGVTFFVDMPNVEPPTSTVESFEEKKKLAGKKSIVDFNHFVFPTVNQIPELVKAGAAGFKVFMLKGVYPYDPRVCVEDHGKLFEIFEEVAKTNRLCSVHPFDLNLFNSLYDARRRDNPSEPKYKSYSIAYMDDSLYTISVSTLIQLAKRTHVRLHILHAHSRPALSLIRDSKEEGHEITCQVDPSYFVLGEREISSLGTLAVPGGFMSADETSIIWKALDSGLIDVLATDHAPHNRDEIMKGMEEDPRFAPSGSPQLEHYLSVFLDQVNKRTLSIERLVSLGSANPAKMINVFPRKGSIRLQSDADFVVVDMKKEMRISSDRLYTKVGWTPYEGRIVKGLPVLTIRRGEIIMEDGVVTGKPGTGQFIPPSDSKLRERERLL
jgi:dihydroorotase